MREAVLVSKFQDPEQEINRLSLISVGELNSLGNSWLYQLSQWPNEKQWTWRGPIIKMLQEAWAVNASELLLQCPEQLAWKDSLVGKLSSELVAELQDLKAVQGDVEARVNFDFIMNASSDLLLQICTSFCESFDDTLAEFDSNDELVKCLAQPNQCELLLKVFDGLTAAIGAVYALLHACTRGPPKTNGGIAFFRHFLSRNPDLLACTAHFVRTALFSHRWRSVCGDDYEAACGRIHLVLGSLKHDHSMSGLFSALLQHLPQQMLDNPGSGCPIESAMMSVSEVLGQMSRSSTDFEFLTADHKCVNSTLKTVWKVCSNFVEDLNAVPSSSPLQHTRTGLTQIGTLRLLLTCALSQAPRFLLLHHQAHTSSLSTLPPHGAGGGGGGGGGPADSKKKEQGGVAAGRVQVIQFYSAHIKRLLTAAPRAAATLWRLVVSLVVALQSALPPAALGCVLSEPVRTIMEDSVMRLCTALPKLMQAQELEARQQIELLDMLCEGELDLGVGDEKDSKSAMHLYLEGDRVMVRDLATVNAGRLLVLQKVFLQAKSMKRPCFQTAVARRLGWFVSFAATRCRARMFTTPRQAVTSVPPSTSPAHPTDLWCQILHALLVFTSSVPAQMETQGGCGDEGAWVEIEKLLLGLCTTQDPLQHALILNLWEFIIRNGDKDLVQSHISALVLKVQHLMSAVDPGVREVDPPCVGSDAESEQVCMQAARVLARLLSFQSVETLGHYHQMLFMDGDTDQQLRTARILMSAQFPIHLLPLSTLESFLRITSKWWQELSTSFCCSKDDPSEEHLNRCLLLGDLTRHLLRHMLEHSPRSGGSVPQLLAATTHHPAKLILHYGTHESQCQPNDAQGLEPSRRFMMAQASAQVVAVGARLLEPDLFSECIPHILAMHEARPTPKLQVVIVQLMEHCQHTTSIPVPLIHAGLSETYWGLVHLALGHFTDFSRSGGARGATGGLHSLVPETPCGSNRSLFQAKVKAYLNQGRQDCVEQFERNDEAFSRMSMLMEYSCDMSTEPHMCSPCDDVFVNLANPNKGVKRKCEEGTKEYPDENSNRNINAKCDSAHCKIPKDVLGEGRSILLKKGIELVKEGISRISEAVSDMPKTKQKTLNDTMESNQESRMHEDIQKMRTIANRMFNLCTQD